MGARASSLAYGNAVMVKYDQSSASHRGRRIVRLLNGAFLEHAWSVVVPLVKPIPSASSLLYYSDGFYSRGNS